MRLKILLLCVLNCYVLTGQNSILNNSECVNYGILNLNSISVSNNWKTSRSPTQGKFSNYGSAKFIENNVELNLNSTPLRWVDGYVKHYATMGNLTHLYPVGSSTERMFLKTSNEFINNNISVTWISGDPSITKDPTDISNDIHPVNLKVEPNLKFVSTIGQWDWSVSNYLGLVNVSVKLPINISLNSINASSNINLRLVGWNGNKWTILQNDNTGSSFERILSGKVSPNITAIGIGQIDNLNTFKDTKQIKVASLIDSNKNNKPINEFKVYPNPSVLGNITLDFNSNNPDKGIIVIMDETGKKVFQQETFFKTINNITINLEKLAYGIYFINLTDLNHNTISNTQKIIIN